MVEQHYVEYASPGTFFNEVSRKEIASWNIAEAVKMLKTIKERYGATPYGFRFLTRSRGPDDLDATETASSPFHFYNCRVLTYHDIVSRNDPNDRILLSNMESNNWTRIAEPREGWKGAYPIRDKDIVL